jgi:hypothetical protein
LTGLYAGTNHHGEPIELRTIKVLAAGETVDLRESILENDR